MHLCDDICLFLYSFIQSFIFLLNALSFPLILICVVIAVAVVVDVNVYYITITPFSAWDRYCRLFKYVLLK